MSLTLSRSMGLTLGNRSFVGSAPSSDPPELTSFVINSIPSPDEIDWVITGVHTSVEWLVSATASYATVALMDTDIAGATAGHTGSATTDPATIDLSAISDGDYYFHAYATHSTNGDQTGAPISEAVTLVSGEVTPSAPTVQTSAVVIDDTVGGTVFTAGSFTATAGSNRVLALMLAFRPGVTNPTSATVTLGSQAATSTIFETGNTSSGAIFTIKEADIPAGANTWTVTFDNSARALAAWVVEIADADQTAFGDEYQAAVASDTVAAVDLTTTAANSLMLSMSCFRTGATSSLPIGIVTDSGTVTTTPTQVETALSGADIAAAIAYQEVASIATVTHTHTKTATANGRAGLGLEILAV